MINSKWNAWIPFEASLLSKNNFVWEWDYLVCLSFNLKSRADSRCRVYVKDMNFNFYTVSLASFCLKEVEINRYLGKWLLISSSRINVVFPHCLILILSTMSQYDTCQPFSLCLRHGFWMNLGLICLFQNLMIILFQPTTSIINASSFIACN